VKNKSLFGVLPLYVVDKSQNLKMEILRLLGAHVRPDVAPIANYLNNHQLLSTNHIFLFDHHQVVKIVNITHIAFAFQFAFNNPSC
jgi:hypothetical protein